MLVADALDVVLAIAVLQHGRTFESLDGDDRRAVSLLEIIARRDRAGRSGRRDEGGEPDAFAALGDMIVGRAAGFAGADIMSHVVGEGGELVEDDVVRRDGELAALVVDLLDVALDADGAHDVGRIARPAFEPVETLPAHAFGQHGDAVAAEDARDRDAAAAIIPGRRPDRAMARRIEAARDQPGDETRIGRQHFVRADHRKTRSDHHDDRRVDARQRLRQDDMIRDRNRVAAIGRVAPVDAPEIVRMRRVGVDVGKSRRDMLRNRRAPGELRKRRQHDLLRPRALDRRASDRWVDDGRRVGEPVESGFGHSGPRPSF